MPAKINLINNRFGKLTVIKETNERKNKSVIWLCKCDCGNEIKLSTKELRNDGIIQCRECGINREPKIIGTENYIGKKFNFLTVLSYNTTNNVKCKCDCGRIIDCNLKNLKQNRRISCGCHKLKYHNNDIVNNRKIIDERVNTSENGKHYYLCKCLLCGREYLSLASNLENTFSCGCFKSKGEYNIIKILNENNIEYQKEYVFKKDNFRLRYDFAIFQDNKIIRLIEFDGEQHYKENIKHSGWNTTEHYKKTHNNDFIKNEIAKDNKIPLVRIPYWERNNITLEMLFGDFYLTK